MTSHNVSVCCFSPGLDWIPSLFFFFTPIQHFLLASARYWDQVSILILGPFQAFETSSCQCRILERVLTLSSTFLSSFALKSITVQTRSTGPSRNLGSSVYLYVDMRLLHHSLLRDRTVSLGLTLKSKTDSQCPHGVNTWCMLWVS